MQFVPCLFTRNINMTSPTVVTKNIGKTVNSAISAVEIDAVPAGSVNMQISNYMENYQNIRFSFEKKNTFFTILLKIVVNQYK